MSGYPKFIILFLVVAFSLNLAAQQEKEKQNQYTDQYLHPETKPKQDENPYPTTRRLFFGGNGFLQLGTYTDIEVSPLVGYWVTPRLAPGAGIKYEYLSDNSTGTRYSTNVFGGSIFTSYLLVKDLNKVFEKMKSNIGILAHVEYELLSMEKSLLTTNPDLSGGSRFLQQNFYVGAGIRQPLGEHSSFFLLILYNLNLNSNLGAYYSNPVFRIGFTF